MNLRTILIVAFLLLSFVAARSYADDPRSPPKQPTPKLSQKEFEKKVFSDEREVILMSHNGQWQGMDNDLELLLRRDGTAVITEYGYAVEKTQAKYRISEDGGIIVTPAGRHSWLAMPLEIENRDLVIHPPLKELFFEDGRKIGVPEAELTDQEYREYFERWPLRQVRTKK